MPRLRARFALVTGLALAALTPAHRAHGEAHADVKDGKIHVDVEAARAKEYAAWHRRIAKIHSPGAGCFTARFPSTTWKSVPCGEPLERHFGGLAGNTNDFYPQAGSSLIGIATGSFTDIYGLMSETGPEGYSTVANSFTLQTNSNHFDARGSNITISDGSNPCAAPGASCDGWQQFVFSNSGTVGVVFIEYWLFGFHRQYGECPSGPPWPSGSPSYPYLPWGQSGNNGDDCYTNSRGTYLPQPVDISQLGQMQFTATALPGALDEVTLTVGGSSYRDSVVSVLGLDQAWTASEFNIFGDGGGVGHVATFNPGTSITVVNTLEGQVNNPLPVSCIAGGFTAESNNLDLACPCFANANTGQIFFTESNATSPACACPYGETWNASSASCQCLPGQSVINGACGCPPGSTYNYNLMRCGSAGPTCPSRCRWGCTWSGGVATCQPPPQ